MVALVAKQAQTKYAKKEQPGCVSLVLMLKVFGLSLPSPGGISSASVSAQPLSLGGQGT